MPIATLAYFRSDGTRPNQSEGHDMASNHATGASGHVSTSSEMQQQHTLVKALA